MDPSYVGLRKLLDAEINCRVIRASQQAGDTMRRAQARSATGRGLGASFFRIFGLKMSRELDAEISFRVNRASRQAGDTVQFA